MPPNSRMIALGGIAILAEVGSPTFRRGDTNKDNVLSVAEIAAIEPS